MAPFQIAAVDELAAAIRANEDVSAMARRILPELERVGDHITQHGNRLMQLAHPGPDRVSPIDLNSIVRDVGGMLKLAGKLGRVELVLVVPERSVTCTVNQTRIEQILVNLIINAVDATSPTGKVTVTVTPRPADKRVTCAVHDDGSGIPPDQLEKIFEPFYTTKGDHGTGLGLPVVREIVNSYDGQLTVDSVPGSTTFTFDLPC